MEKLGLAALCASLVLIGAGAKADEAAVHALISRHAVQNNVPETLVHRVVRRESNYNPRAVGSGGAMGLMQIKAATARGMGYAGPPSGLLDADTNLTYAVRYLAGAYRVAGGNHDRAVAYYASGYYYAAKRMGLAGSKIVTAAPRAADQAPVVNQAGTITAAVASAEVQPSLADLR